MFDELTTENVVLAFAGERVATLTAAARNSSLAGLAETAPLNRALDQSELVQGKVEQAASDLASVNAVLKNEIIDGLPTATVERALDKSEQVEAKVLEAAQELVAVNDALAEEIDERHLLEERLHRSDVALAESRSDERKFRHDAMHDVLTGLPNMALFSDRLINALAQAQRHDWRLAVMFIDLDAFKSINDTHGHDAGDEMLRAVARCLQTSVRRADSVCRRSGDEFLFLMLEAKDESNVAPFAARLLQKLAEGHQIDGASLPVKASIGIAMYPEDGRSPEELLKHADMAMYCAKQKKSGPVFYSQTSVPQVE